MKDLIVLIAMIVLGVAIFNLIAGPDDNSIKSTLNDVWQQELQLKTIGGQ